jgi:hypothetical protein
MKKILRGPIFTKTSFLKTAKPTRTDQSNKWTSTLLGKDWLRRKQLAHFTHQK